MSHNCDVPGFVPETSQQLSLISLIHFPHAGLPRAGWPFF
jgi:hypothetical protein